MSSHTLSGRTHTWICEILLRNNFINFTQKVWFQIVRCSMCWKVEKWKLAKTNVSVHTHTRPNTYWTSSDLHWDSRDQHAWLQLFHSRSGYPATTVPNVSTKGTTPRQTTGTLPKLPALLQAQRWTGAQNQRTPWSSRKIHCLHAISWLKKVTVIWFSHRGKRQTVNNVMSSRVSNRDNLNLDEI